jgi:hypothetical protein
MRIDTFMEKLNLDKFSQRLQEMNRYLDFIPMRKNRGKNSIMKAYGKALPDDEIIFIMGRAIPMELTVNLFALGKESWKLKGLNASWLPTANSGNLISESRSC